MGSQASQKRVLASTYCCAAGDALDDARGVVVVVAVVVARVELVEGGRLLARTTHGIGLVPCSKQDGIRVAQGVSAASMKAIHARSNTGRGTRPSSLAR